MKDGDLNIRSLEDSVTMAMDITGKGEILPFLPYILQDFWELGSDPETIIPLIREHYRGTSNPKVLDLGCGKGAVSVKIAEKLGHSCFGVDAIPEFISVANEKAKEYKVENLCHFEIGDVRDVIKNIPKYDIIILGSVGPVFGDYYQTLTALKSCLSDFGIIIIDDGYIQGENDFEHPLVMRKDELLKQVKLAGMEIIDEIAGAANDCQVQNYDTEYSNICKRCDQLIAIHPDKAELFQNYKVIQRQEYDNLKSEITCSTMVFALQRLNR